MEGVVDLMNKGLKGNESHGLGRKYDERAVFLYFGDISLKARF